MDQQKRVLQTGAVAVVFAITLRLLGGGFLPSVGELLQKQRVLSLVAYFHTGRVVRFPHPVQPRPPEEVPDEPTVVPEDTRPVFSAGELTGVNYGCSYRPDLDKLLCKPLVWDLYADAPTVLILHSHATESFTKAPGDSYKQHAAYRTLNEDYNMVSIGREVVRILKEAGINVVHDTTYHDYPSYNKAYTNARASIQEYLKQYPTIQLVLDLHRDASEGTGGQMVTVGSVGGQRSAQLMVVVGTDAGGNVHPDWQENLALGLKLTAILERSDPGVTRQVNLRSARFNMDLTPGSLLIEVGAAGNTRAEAMLAAGALARGILELAKGSS